MSDIGSRMKENYELPARQILTRRIPVIVRVDGRSFHTFTKKLARPFDLRIIGAMNRAALWVAQEMQGCKAFYVQSDEASFLLTDYDGLQTEPWFGYVKSKVETIAASAMTAAFNADSDTRSAWTQASGFPWPPPRAMFDARAFNIPREEVENYFLWRIRDWERNSIQMYARSVFSSSQLHCKPAAAIHEMLHEKGLNWANLRPVERNGTLWLKVPGSDFESRCDGFRGFRELQELLEPLVNCDEVMA